MADLDTDGLYPVTWDSCDGCDCSSLFGSPQDAGGRGILLTITRDGEAVDLSGGDYHLYFLWLHRQQHERGCVAMEAVDASAGKFSVYFPAGMIGFEGEAVCSVVLSRGEKSIATPTFSVRVDEALVSTLAIEDGFTLFSKALKAYETGTEDLLALVADLETMRDSGEFDGASGAAGKDGVSVTHSWDGTVLSITSASGTSSADLVGPQGPQGETGLTGPQGEKGDAGADGAAAEISDVMAAVIDDVPGTPAVAVSMMGTAQSRVFVFEFSHLKGEKGDAGETGATGAAFTFDDFTDEQRAALKGEKGETGEQGPQGETGATGAAGADGVSCTHSWDGTVLTVTSASGASSADLVGPQGPQGETGATGASGTDGRSASINAVTASVDSTTGSPSVEVTLGGSQLYRNFDFAFSGLKGEKGETGATGATGATGPQGPAGADGTTFTASSPLSLTDGVLSVDLSSYATQEWVKTYLSETFPDLSEVSY